MKEIRRPIGVVGAFPDGHSELMLCAPGFGMWWDPTRARGVAWTWIFSRTESWNPKCNGALRIPAFIGDQEVIRKIFSHLGLWKRTSRAPPHPPRPLAWIPACPRSLPGKTNSTRTRGSPSTGLHSPGQASLPGRGVVRLKRPPDDLPPWSQYVVAIFSLTHNHVFS